MQIFQNLRVWQEAHAFSLQIYKATQNFPKSEQFGITSQLRKAASSVMANLAEGCGRGSNKDFGRFIQYAIGSSFEVESFLLLAADLNYLDQNQSAQLCQQVVELRTQLLKLKERVGTSQPRNTTGKPKLPVRF